MNSGSEMLEPQAPNQPHNPPAHQAQAPTLSQAAQASWTSVEEPAQIGLTGQALAWLGSQPKWLSGLVCGGLLGLITLGDYATDYDLHFFLFYALQLSLVTWIFGKRAGRWDALLCALAGWAVNAHLISSSHSLLITGSNTAIWLVFFLLNVELIAWLNQLVRDLETLAHTDGLTGIQNRRAFYESLVREYRRSLRKPEPLSVVYLDLDNFKQVNDRLGHPVGDELLKAVGATLKSSLRQTDVVARLGGDEFAVLLLNAPPSSALEVTERLNQQLLSVMQSHHWPVTCSIGIASFETMPSAFDQLIQNSDQLMYQVKKTGKNRILQQCF